MKILAMSGPKTGEQLREWRIAKLLDEAFITAPGGLHKLNGYVAKDFDELVAKLLVASRPVNVLTENQIQA